MLRYATPLEKNVKSVEKRQEGIKIVKKFAYIQ